MPAIPEKSSDHIKSNDDTFRSFSIISGKKPELPKHLRFLVVEDNLLIQFAVRAMLGELGYNFNMAANGLTAIELARYYKGYDLILMDLDLPDTTGIELTKVLLSLDNTKNVPIVAMTSHTRPEYKAYCYAAGMVGFYNKPKDTHDIIRMIQNHVTQKPEMVTA